MYANVIVDITHERLDKTFQYRVPKELEEKLRPGMQVWFPFGNGNRKQKGFILELTDRAEYDPDKIKTLTGIVDEAVLAEGELIALAAWIRENYGSTMIQALKTVLPVRDKVRSVEKITIFPAKSEEEMGAYLDLCTRRKYKARIRLLELLKEKGTLSIKEAEEADVSRNTVKELEEKGYIRLNRETLYRNPSGEMSKAYERKYLSQEQQKAVDTFVMDYEDGRRGTYLLHGVTGSGKTEVYLDAMEQVIESGSQVIVLIPEIALTYQTLMRFYTKIHIFYYFYIYNKKY